MAARGFIQHRLMIHRAHAALILVVVAIAGAYLWWRVGMLAWVRRDHVVGIDVSHHQGSIDWRRVREAGVGFAILKATEGVTFTDSAFAENFRAAGRAGLVRGAYHFFTFCTPGKDQAAHFAEIVPVEAGALPPVIDLELGGNCAARPAPDRLKAELDDFLGVIEPRYGQAILYITEDFYERYGAVTEGRKLFLREIFQEPRWAEGRPWLLWQFHNSGRIDGVEGPVDLDALQGSMDLLRALARPTPK
ncbi:Lyzozyme M1 (1,4-beta-N-acetylmuramidase) [Minicystis rosea]|nr:Lyzozyme M1 (1,4-beta-N-acetylmuramidase) [Minicystis rosea]